jgi:AraC family transcriptional regulator
VDQPEVGIWNGQRPRLERTMTWCRQADLGSLNVVSACESLERPTDWCFEEDHHSLVIHLDGRLRRMEMEFSRGPSGSVLPAPGDIWIIPAGCRYAALAQGDKAAYLQFTIPTALVHDDAMRACVGARDDFLHVVSMRLDGLLRRPGDDLAAMTAHALGHALEMHLRDRYGRPPVPAGKIALTRADCLLLRQAICDELDGRHSLEALAALVGMPVRRFTTAFRQAFGMTPWQFVLDARLAAAADLLRTTNDPVTVIALAVGFATPSHFATAFARHHGVSPSRYRILMA